MNQILFQIKDIDLRPFSLQLGGKDPAYVRADADLKYTVAELVDGEEFYHPTNLYGLNGFDPGAYFNSGQSCCAVEVTFNNFLTSLRQSLN